MDIILRQCDELLLDRVWAYVLPSSMASSAHANLTPTASLSSYYDQAVSRSSFYESAWPRDDWRRQYISLYAMVLVSIFTLYFIVAGLSYRYVFDKRMMKHPRFLKNQVKLEILSSLNAFPWLDLMTTPWFLGEVRGYSLLYDSIHDSPFGHGLWRSIAYMVLSSAFFLWFTDVCIYLVHRAEHHPLVYKRIHKPHHRWIIPTPFASHAFHPLDGYAQSLPYHIFAYIVPLHKWLYMGLFVFVNLWSILIHDSDMIVDHPLERWINGPAHHTLHHIHFNVNYGQYFVWCDKAGGSFRQPAKTDDPLLAVLAAEEKRKAAKVELQKQRQLAIEIYESEKLKEAEMTRQTSERLAADTNSAEASDEEVQRATSMARLSSASSLRHLNESSSSGSSSDSDESPLHSPTLRQRKVA
ncbi:uncharacterized protein L969DRAFT_84926 [Mixia osmundae IAM 14324]|uniref:Fatty acid hydroxylase domain-containing protein n=1 Tax=Mixia osmundae (strain CBS 9802 / IAM 14324 / JCM 22182 / KY 12970) TaxID=764103 RepID=G7DXM2_MIXOS|nr:uncharacterized protein L969DRAFT_84926 [Mixia osmundae IAM 14324]KEI41174.1 hypothetical protein L969DRAFT_84926 [Mixia osmundae IAM 14324]GAA95332.1 hypothetical protein E5Q_01989 [Mixia osmundae IAM 14324]